MHPEAFCKSDRDPSDAETIFQIKFYLEKIRRYFNKRCSPCPVGVSEGGVGNGIDSVADISSVAAGCVYKDIAGVSENCCIQTG